MKTEAPLSDVAYVRSIYSPDIVRDIRKRKYINSWSEDWWGSSFSTSRNYSRDLGILLMPQETLETLTSLKPLDRTSCFRLLSELLAENPVKKLIEAKKQEGELYMLDLMSYGEIHRELDVKGCAVALSDRRTSDIQATPVELIAGDVLHSRTWQKIDKYLELNTNGEKFGIILSHPIGGLTKIPMNLTVYQYLFNHVYRILSNNDGVFLTNFHTKMFEQVEDMCKKLNGIEGIEASCYSDDDFSIFAGFMLRKSSGAPEKLPLIEL